jgi:hypothetical protein
MVGITASRGTIKTRKTEIITQNIMLKADKCVEIRSLKMKLR